MAPAGAAENEAERFGRMKMVDMVITKIELTARKSRSVNVCPASGIGTSEISPVPKNTRIPDSNIKQNQAAWEYGFLWPGTPAQY